MPRNFLLYTRKVILLLVFVTVMVAKSDGDENKHHVMTQSETLKLEQLKNRVSQRLPYDYMNADAYLSRWLYANNFDLTRAEDALMENLTWRKEFKMDYIQEQTFSDIKDICPFYVDTIAKNGQPVLTFSAEECDLRLLFGTERQKRLMRYIFQQLDKATIMVDLAAQAGTNVTSFMIIANLGGFNLLQLTCPQCMVSLVEFILQLEKFYFDYIDKTVIVDTPDNILAIFGPIINAVLSRCSNDNSLQVKVFGTNRREWQHYLLDFIEETQLHEEFGGSRTVHN